MPVAWTAMDFPLLRHFSLLTTRLHGYVFPRMHCGCSGVGEGVRVSLFSEPRPLRVIERSGLAEQAVSPPRCQIKITEALLKETS